MNCLFRLINCIIYCREAYIEYFGTADRSKIDARDVKGPWDAIAYVYNSSEANTDVDENLLQSDHNVTGHVASASDFFLLRHPCTPAELEKHHNEMKAKVNIAMIKKTASGQGDNDGAAEIQKLVEQEAISRRVDLDDDN
jgi:hypothetical protein